MSEVGRRLIDIEDGTFIFSTDCGGSAKLKMIDNLKQESLGVAEKDEPYIHVFKYILKRELKVFVISDNKTEGIQIFNILKMKILA